MSARLGAKPGFRALGHSVPVREGEGDARARSARLGGVFSSAQYRRKKPGSGCACPRARLVSGAAPVVKALLFSLGVLLRGRGGPWCWRPRRGLQELAPRVGGLSPACEL